jgi:hypothetical protein
MPNGLTRYSHLKLVTLNPAIAIPPVISKLTTKLQTFTAHHRQTVKVALRRAR